MYLARRRVNRNTHFFIRQSVAGPGYMWSRDLFSLGTDPSRFIIYPGGISYYYNPCIEESLRQQGLEVTQNDLDDVFFEFLRPETQRVIAGFDRRTKRKSLCPASGPFPAVHIFDKRRFHYLRFGYCIHQYINRVPEKIFRPLMYKSRDEMEQYFLTAERVLRPNERLNYIAVIFELKRFVPDPESNLSAILQLDNFFTDRLCRLNRDAMFMAGVPDMDVLYEHLVKYAIMYFDAEAVHHQHNHDYIQEFINRHRRYTPPQKIRIKIQEAERLFGRTWKELQRMDRAALSRIYRQMALKHHPDRGGQSESFRRLTAYYKALMDKR